MEYSHKTKLRDYTLHGGVATTEDEADIFDAAITIARWALDGLQPSQGGPGISGTHTGEHTGEEIIQAYTENLPDDDDDNFGEIRSALMVTGAKAEAAKTVDRYIERHKASHV